MSPRSAGELAQRLGELTRELGEEMTLDGLTGAFKIFQRRRGHRHSTDDLLTGWYAVVHAPRRGVRTAIDLGTGIGSVGLMVASTFVEASVTAIEVQDVSYRLLRENVWANGVEDRVRTIHGDSRHSTPEMQVDLVTGSPPYFDVRTGIVSADSQRAGARFELRGDVTDYCKAARRVMAPGARFVFCFPTVQRARAEKACEGAGLPMVATCDVIPKEGAPALFSLFACRREDEAGEASEASETRAAARVDTLTVRDRAGVHTPEMTAARALFGLAAQS